MFTGLIEKTAKVIAVSKNSLRIDVGENFLVSVGDSVAVDGVCLTVTKQQEQIVFFDVSHESLNLTTLLSIKINDMLNIERALLAGSRMHGHFVTGHVDTTGLVDKIEKKDSYYDVFIKFKDDGIMHNYIAPKGSITINGISLTINQLNSNDSFKLTLIPHTLQVTNLFDIKIGQKVNIEFDVLAKYIYGMINNKFVATNTITQDKLRSLGYV